METGNFYEYDFLYPMIQELVENMFKASGIDLCLTSGTDENGHEYPTNTTEHKLFYEEMEKIAPYIREMTKKVQDEGIATGIEHNQNSIKAVLGIKFGSQI